MQKEIFDKLKQLNEAMLDSKGREINNPVPINYGVKLEKPPSLKDQIKRIIRSEVAQQAADEGMETWEESNDFEVLDDFEVTHFISQYEIMEEETLLDPSPTIKDEPIVEPEASESVENQEEEPTPAENVDNS